VFTESVPDLPLTGEDALSDTEAKPRTARKRAGAAEKKTRTTPRKSAAVSAEGEKPAPRRAARKSKTASE
jgi:hypothetical protein